MVSHISHASRRCLSASLPPSGSQALRTWNSFPRTMHKTPTRIDGQCLVFLSHISLSHIHPQLYCLNSLVIFQDMSPQSQSRKKLSLTSSSRIFLASLVTMLALLHANLYNSFVPTGWGTNMPGMEVIPTSKSG